MPIDLKKEKEKLVRKAIVEAKEIGADMALRRLRKGLKQSWVARQMKIHPSHLCDMEQGKRNWRDYHVRAFLEAIGESTNNKRKG